MGHNKLPEHYRVADGPEGLRAVLSELKAAVETDEGMRLKEHYILYQFGQQKSLIKTDMSIKPFLFWYYDLLGRPATSIVKDTIANFLWEECGEREQFLREYDLKEHL